MKKLLVVLLLLGTVAVGVAYVLNGKTSAAIVPPRREKVERADITEKVPAMARVYPTDVAFVATDVAAARVVDVEPIAKVGGKVEKDQLLLKLDDELVRAKLAEAESAVKLAEASKVQAEASKSKAIAGKRKAELDLELANKKLDVGVKAGASAGVLAEGEAMVKAASEGINVAEAQIKEAEAAILAAEANILRATAGVAAAKQMLAYYEIRAPITGTIIERKVTKGQLIAPQATPILFVIAPDLGRMELQAQVAEADISKIREGMAARFSVDAYSEEGARFRATVRALPFVPTVPSTRALDLIPGLGGGGAGQLSGPVFYPVTLDVESQTGEDSRPLLSGFTANVDFIVKEVKDALVVPNQALVYRPDHLPAETLARIEARVQSGWRSLWLYRNGSEPELIFVRPGATDGGRTEIVEVDGKLEPGMEVITDAPPVVESPGGLFNVRLPRLG